MLAMRSVPSLCLFCCVVANGANAQAQGPETKLALTTSATPNLDEPEAVAKARARLLFDKGVNAYRDGRFYDAVDIFLETNRLYPDPKLSFNVGKAFEALGNQPGALRYYREYLRRMPDAPDKREVDSHVEQLELSLGQKGLQQLTVLSTPDGATIKLDGQAVGVTPWTGESFAGKHRVALEAAQYQTSERIIEIDLHRAQDFTFELSPMPKPEPPRVVLAATHAEPKISVLTLGTLAGGLALLGTALIAQAASSGDSHGASRSAAFFAGGGASVSVLGGVMLYFDLNPGSGAHAASGVSWGGAGLEHSH
jgi:tetratricopeptide (TPR) repeat protein